jgi:hypothetical protein
LMKKPVVLGIMVTVLCAVGCNQTNEVVDAQRAKISMTFSNLPHLQEGQGHYQLWAKFMIFNKAGQNDSPQHDSTAASLGEFNVSEDGQSLIALDGNPMRFTIPADQNPQLIDDIILTIQEEEHGLAKTNHEEPGPAFLGGKVHGDALVGIADLDASYSHALGSTFSDPTGKYTIIAPTSPADSNSGAWFIEQQGTTIVAGLRSLPTLPEGWVYEGWVGLPVVEIHSGKLAAFQYFSTGRFVRADSADFDGAGPGKGPGLGYNFPGQDFINPPGNPVKPDLRFSMCMVTVEPEPDNFSGPFSLRMLSTPLSPTHLPQGQALQMENVAATSFPRAKITIDRSGN